VGRDDVDKLRRVPGRPADPGERLDPEGELLFFTHMDFINAAFDEYCNFPVFPKIF